MRTIQEIRHELEELRHDDTVERLLARAREHRVEAMRLLGLPPVELDREDPQLLPKRR
jgi:hypothetical protein